MRHAFSAPSGLVVALGMSLAAALGADAASPAPTTLAYKASKDDVFRYRFALKATFDVSGPMGEGPLEVSQEQYVTFRVLDVDAKGTLHLRATLERLRGGFEAAMMGQELGFDTDDAPPAEGEDGAPAMQEDPIVKFARALKGSGCEVWLTAQGKVQKISGATKAVEAARKKAGDQGAGGDGMPFGGLSVGALAQQYDDQGLAQILEAALPRLPETPVDVGDSWKSPASMGMAAIGHDLKIDVTLALSGVEDDVATLLAAGGVKASRRETAEPKGAPGDDPMADMQREIMKNMKLEIAKSSVDGTVRWSVGKALPDESAITAKVTATMAMKLPGMEDMGGEGGPATGGMKFDIKGTVRVSTKLLSLTHGTGGEGF